MSSDRGTTMHRGMGQSVDQPEPWTQPTAPAARKLPGAPRERKPALAALAVVLILGGALAVGYVMLQSAKRVDAIEITQQVGLGQQIPLSAMQEVQVAANSGFGYVPWSEAGQVTHSFAATTILKGTLLTSSMALATDPVVNGRDTMGLALKDGQLPAGLTAGDDIDIYEVSDASEACPGQPGSLLSGDAVVLSISAPSATSSSAVADVEVALDPATAGAVACNASNGILSVAVTPGSFLSQGSTAAGTGSSAAATPGRSAGTTPSQKATGTGTGTGAG
ncbi:MAG: hypothetical protein ABSF03_09520 [Streptosporangiaceae bacterium]